MIAWNRVTGATGADIVSGGELHRAIRAGIPGDRIVFAGVGKTASELRAAVGARIHGCHVESAGELRLLDAVAAEMGVPARIADTKFGIPLDQVMELYRWAASRPHLDIRGIDAHIGSGILDPAPYGRVLDLLLEVVAQLAREGIELEYLDIGGGFGVPQGDESGMPVERLAELVVPRVREAGLDLVVEPGRYIVAEAGTLLTTVLYVKRNGDKTFVVTDGGMTELIRPSLYSGFHRVEPAAGSAIGGVEERVDVVGPICETGDFLALDRRMAVPSPGDVLAGLTAGAYGSSMASNYNSRLRPAEVLVEDGHALLVRARESLEDLTRGETIPPRPENTTKKQA